MARIRPFRGWRYPHDTHDLSSLIAPPYDVISPDYRAVLAGRDPHNVIELELPEGSPEPGAADNRYSHAAELWNAWRDGGVLVREDTPSLYLIEQRYQLEGRPVRRRAVFCELAIQPFDAGVVLAHERTLPKALGDRFELIQAAKANFSPIFGLFSDPADVTGAAFGALADRTPDAAATDDDGVETLLWVVDDDALVSIVTAAVSAEKVFIADGHHRYTTALAYRDLRRSQAEAIGERPHDKDYDFVLMALVNMEDPELVVLPYHRIARANGSLDPGAFKARLEDAFELATVPDSRAFRGALAEIDAPAFGVALASTGELFVASVRPGVDLDSAIAAEQSAEWKRLDTAVLQELVLGPILDIHPDRPETLQRLTFAKGTRAALELGADYDVVFLMRSTGLEQLRAVALNDETMPQKSTYFYPKLPAGFVMRGIED